MIYMEALSGCIHAVEVIDRFILFEKHEAKESKDGKFIYFIFSLSEIKPFYKGVQFHVKSSRLLGCRTYLSFEKT